MAGPRCSMPEARTATEPPRGPARRTAMTRRILLTEVVEVASRWRCTPVAAAAASVVAEAKPFVPLARDEETTAPPQATVAAGLNIEHPDIVPMGRAVLNTKSALASLALRY